MFTENLAALFADGLSATVGAETGRVHFDLATQSALGGMVLDDEPSALMATSTFALLAEGDTIVIAGKGTYVVREVRLLDDGAIKRAMLRAA